MDSSKHGHLYSRLYTDNPWKYSPKTIRSSHTTNRSKRGLPEAKPDINIETTGPFIINAVSEKNITFRPADIFLPSNERSHGKYRTKKNGKRNYFSHEHCFANDTGD